MKSFAQDIWQDLREKRLWPVAALLLVALIAVPLVLSKGGGSDPEPATPVATPKPVQKDDEQLAKLATVELEESAPGEGSTLDTFDPSNPFRPPEKVTKASDESKAGAEAGPTDDVSVDVTDDQTDVTVDESGGSGPNGGGTTDGGSNGDDKPQETVTTQYKYVIDVTFVANGKKRNVKGMERLDMLPNQGNPLLLFLGAEADGGNAVFLVDSTLTAAGEGRCKPSASKCAFLHIGPGSEHEFTNEAGDSYTLRINEIRKVKVEAQSAKSSGRKRAGASVGSTRRFTPLAISDFVTETTKPADTAEKATDDSSSADEGR